MPFIVLSLFKIDASLITDSISSSFLKKKLNKNYFCLFGNFIFLLKV